MERGAQCWNDKGRNSEQHQRGDHSGRLTVEPLGAVLQSAEKEREAENEKGIAEYRSDESGLDDVREPRTKREDRNEKLRQVAERRLQNSCRARTKSAAELHRRVADDDGRKRKRDRR